MVATHLLVVTKYIILYIKGVRAIAPAENYPRSGLGFVLGSALELGLGGNFPREQLRNKKQKMMKNDFRGN